MKKPSVNKQLRCCRLDSAVFCQHRHNIKYVCSKISFQRRQQESVIAHHSTTKLRKDNLLLSSLAGSTSLEQFQNDWDKRQCVSPMILILCTCTFGFTREVLTPIADQLKHCFLIDIPLSSIPSSTCMTKGNSFRSFISKFVMNL